MDMYLSGKLYAKKLTARKNFKMLKLPLSFVFLALKGYFFNMSIYDLLLVNLHGQIYPGQQNAKDITCSSLKITAKYMTIFQELIYII